MRPVLAQRFDAAAGARRRLGGRRVPTAVIAVALLAALVALTAWYWPIALDEKLFLVYDPGSALKADRLLSRGLVPTVDFAYSYGLLTLAVGRVWFALFGHAPLAYEALTLACSALVMAGAVVFARALAFDWVTVGLLALLAPWLVAPFYLNQAHALEAALVVWALALHARRRPAAALVLLTVCLFVKPSMAYVYGLLLVMRIVTAAWGRRAAVRGVARDLLPAALTGGALLLAMLAWFGARPLVHTLVPLQAQASYRAAGFGFFDAGQRFVRHAALGYYVDHEIGFWLFASIVLVAAAGAAAVRQAAGGRTHHGDPAPRRREMLIVIAALHVAFVFGFYGYENSWRYYQYLLPLGLATGLMLLPASRARVSIAALCAIVGLVSVGSSWAVVGNAWRYKQRVEAGLWAYDDFHAELQKVERLTQGRDALALVNGDFTAFTGMATPPSWFLSPALQLPPEQRAIADELERATVVVRMNELGKLDPYLEYAPRAAGPPFEVEYQGTYFTVMARTAPASAPATEQGTQ